MNNFVFSFFFFFHLFIHIYEGAQCQNLRNDKIKIVIKTKRFLVIGNKNKIAIIFHCKVGKKQMQMSHIKPGFIV